MKKILVALDDSPRRHGVLRVAAKLAADSGAKLVLFRAIALSADAAAQGYTTTTAGYTSEIERQARADLELAAREVGTDRVLSAKVEIGTPWRAICREAIGEDVDMIVLGSHGYDTVDRVLGTTAAKVVDHADRSVLVVRADERLAAA